MIKTLSGNGRRNIFTGLFLVILIVVSKFTMGQAAAASSFLNAVTAVDEIEISGNRQTVAVFPNRGNTYTAKIIIH